MRTRHLGRRRTDPMKDTGSGLPEFEFAHLLDAVSRADVDAVPNVVTDVAPDVEPEVVPDVVLDVVPEFAPDVEPEVAPDVHEVAPEVEPEVAVSRFADAGLDDDRLPVTVKRRRGRRR